ncbi:hypothetical protein MJO28_007616, partial [Puccinia striiformis f. sp. tritici]
MDLESLRAAANHYAVQWCMSHGMRDEVDDLHSNSKCLVVRTISNPIFSLIIWAILTKSMAGQPGIHFKNTIVAHKLFDT